MKKTISFVIPCYNSELTIEDVVEEIFLRMNELQQYDEEIILINDCSKDNTYAVLCKLCESNKKIKAINFTKNFGQHAAIMAGFQYVNGDYVICLDDDGQMPLESIPEMMECLENGYDVVSGLYKNVHQSLYRRIGSKINAFMCELLINKPRDITMNSFWGAHRFVIDEMVKYQGAYPYIGGLILRTTNNICNIEVEHRDRLVGNSGYSFLKLIKLWMNGFTAFSQKPLQFASMCGFTCSALGLIFAVVTVIRKLLNPSILTGYSSLIAVILFTGGLNMLLLGMLGEYIGRMYICMNQAPQYVIRETKNIDE
ncbi:MAG: glycosyltransferase family 2 protein [Lachnospiraceae bacterium]